MGLKNKVTSSVILSVFSVTQCGFLEASATSKTKTSENLVNDLSKKVKSGDASKGNGKKVIKKKNVKKGEENLKAKNNVSIEQVTKSTGTESKKDEKKADDVLIKAKKIQKAGADSDTAGKKSKNKLRKESKKPEKEAKVETEETKTEVGSKKDKEEKTLNIGKSTETNTNDSKVLKTEDKSEDIEDSIKEVKEENNKVDGSQIGNDLNGETKGKSKEEIFESKENQNKHGKNELIDDFDKVFDGSYDDFSSGKSSKSSNNFFKNFDVGDTVIASSLALAGTSFADRKFNNGRLSSFIGNLLFSRKNSSNSGTKHQEEESIVPKENVPKKKESKKVENKPLDYPLKLSFMPYQIASAISNKEVSVPLFDSNGPIVGFLNNWANVALKGSFDKGYGELFGDWLSYILNPKTDILLYWSIVRKVLWPLLTCFPDIFSFFKNELIEDKFVAVMFAYLFLPFIVYFLIGHKLIHQKLGFEPLVALQRLIDREGKWYEIAGLAVRDVVRYFVGHIWYIFAGLGNFGKRLYYEKSLFPNTGKGILGTLSFTGKIFPAVYYISKVTNLFKGDSDAIKLLSYVNKEGKASNWVVDKGIFTLKNSFKAIELNKKLEFFNKDNGEVNIDKIFEYAKKQIVLKESPDKRKKVELNGKITFEKADEKFLEFINLPWWEFGDWIGAMPKRLRYIHDEVLEKLIEFTKKDENNDEKEAVNNYLERTKLYGKTLKNLFEEDLNDIQEKLIEIQSTLENIFFSLDYLEQALDGNLDFLTKGNIYNVLTKRAKVDFIQRLLGMNYNLDPTINEVSFTPKGKIDILRKYFTKRKAVKEALEEERRDLFKKLSNKKLIRLFTLLNKENEISKKISSELVSFVSENKNEGEKLCDFVENEKVKVIINSKYENIKNNKGKMENDIELVANLKNNLALKKLIAVTEVLFNADWKEATQDKLNEMLRSNENKAKNRINLLSAWFKNYGTGNVTTGSGIDDVKKVSKVVVGLWADKNKLIEEIRHDDDNFAIDDSIFDQANMSVEAMIQKLGAKDLVPGVELSAKAVAQLIAEIDNAADNDYNFANYQNTKELKGKVDALCRALGKNVPDFVDDDDANNRRNAKDSLEDILNNFIKSADYKGKKIISELEDLLKVNNEKNPSGAELSAAGLIISKLATEGENENKGNKFRDLLFKRNNEVNKTFSDLLVKYYNLRKEDITKDNGCKSIADILVLLMCSDYSNNNGELNTASLKYQILKYDVIGQNCSEDINNNNVKGVLNDLLKKVDNKAKEKLGNNKGDMYKELVRLMQLLVPAEEVDKKSYFRNNFARLMDPLHIGADFVPEDNNLKLLKESYYNSQPYMF